MQKTIQKILTLHQTIGGNKTSTTSITFTSGLTDGDIVKYRILS